MKKAVKERIHRKSGIILSTRFILELRSNQKRWNDVHLCLHTNELTCFFDIFNLSLRGNETPYYQKKAPVSFCSLQNYTESNEWKTFDKQVVQQQNFWQYMPISNQPVTFSDKEISWKCAFSSLEKKIRVTRKISAATHIMKIEKLLCSAVSFSQTKGTHSYKQLNK